MKNRRYSKIITMILTMAMVLSMGSFAFAAQDTVGDATIETATDSATLIIPKTVTVTNPEEIKVYGPTVAYTFSVAPATVASGTTVKSDAEAPDREEGDYATAVVKAGVEGGVTVTTQPSFTTGETTVATGTLGVELTSNLVVTTDISKFSKAGVYRYEITDATETSTLTAAGITRETDYDATRYLDVYIYNDGDSLKIGGYTLLKENTKETTGDNDTTVKSPGFTSGATVDENGKVTAAGSVAADYYNTINVSLEKEVTGALGDKTNEFPFAIALSNSGMTYYTTSDSSAQGTAGTATSISQTLKHGDQFFIKGLNPKATVNYTETNNTEDTYTVTVTGKSSDIVSATEVAASGTQAMGAQAVSNYSDCSTQSITGSNASVVKFTNNLDEVSPTNVVLRYAPYLFMLAAAIALFMISRRRKSEEE